jgi:hypothetical protein
MSWWPKCYYVLKKVKNQVFIKIHNSKSSIAHKYSANPRQFLFNAINWQIATYNIIPHYVW